MNNETPFLKDLMRNSIHQDLVIDISDLPPKEYWWEFEEKCLGNHFGIPRSEFDEWWDTFIVNHKSNFVQLKVEIKDNCYAIYYRTEKQNLKDVYDYHHISSFKIIPFGDIYNKYLLPEKQEDLNGYATGGYTIDDKKYEPAGIIHRGEYDYIYDTEKPNIEASVQKLEEALEEIEILNSTIKDMEEIIKTLEANLTFTWSMLEIKIKENK